MRRRGGWFTVLLVLLAGAVAGSVAGQALAGQAPLLGRSVSVGLQPPVTLDLSVLSLTLGFVLRLNLGAAIGLLLALLVYRRA